MYGTTDTPGRQPRNRISGENLVASETLGIKDPSIWGVPGSVLSKVYCYLDLYIFYFEIIIPQDENVAVFVPAESFAVSFSIVLSEDEHGYSLWGILLPARVHAQVVCSQKFLRDMLRPVVIDIHQFPVALRFSHREEALEMFECMERATERTTVLQLRRCHARISPVYSAFQS